MLLYEIDLLGTKGQLNKP